MKQLKSGKENPSFEIQTLTRMFIQMSQQHEVKENNHVIIPSYVEIQKTYTLQGCKCFRLQVAVMVKFSHNENFLSNVNLLVSKHYLNHFVIKEML